MTACSRAHTHTRTQISLSLSLSLSFSSETHTHIHTQEERAKQGSRASRFNITEPQGPKYAPDEDEVAKAARAKKFGVEGYEPATSVMMDMGKLLHTIFTCLYV
jgi:hypothetical protein